MAFDQQFNWNMDRLIKDLTAQRKKRLAFNQDISSREMAETERAGSFQRNQDRSTNLSTRLDKNYDRQLANDRITSRKHDEYAVNDGSLDEKIFGMRWGASGSSGGGGVKPGGSKGSGANSTGWDLSGKDRADLFARAYQHRGESAADEDFGPWLARNRKGFDAGNQVGEQADPVEQRKQMFAAEQTKFNTDVRSFVDDKGVFHATNYEGPYKASWDNKDNDMQEGAAALSRNARWAGQGGKGNAPTEKTTTGLGELLEGITPDRKRPPVGEQATTVVEPERVIPFGEWAKENPTVANRSALASLYEKGKNMPKEERDAIKNKRTAAFRKSFLRTPPGQYPKNPQSTEATPSIQKQPDQPASERQTYSKTDLQELKKQYPDLSRSELLNLEQLRKQYPNLSRKELFKMAKQV